MGHRNGHSNPPVNEHFCSPSNCKDAHCREELDVIMKTRVMVYQSDISSIYSFGSQSIYFCVIRKIQFFFKEIY